MFVDGKAKAFGGFHGYWDTKVVDGAFGDTTDAQVALALAQKEPAGWKLTGNPDALAQQMADEILPIAREAHRRLEYSKIRIEGDGDIAGGRALERQVAGEDSYAAWSQAWSRPRSRRPAGGWLRFSRRCCGSQKSGRKYRQRGINWLHLIWLDRGRAAFGVSHTGPCQARASEPRKALIFDQRLTYFAFKPVFVGLRLTNC